MERMSAHVAVFIRGGHERLEGGVQAALSFRGDASRMREHGMASRSGRSFG
jgi:hypothetical protein